MNIYTVHLRHSGLDPERDLVLVKEGFSFPAFLFGSFWALVKGLWLPLLVLALVNFGVMALAWAFDLAEPEGFLVMLGAAAIVGFAANDLWRWQLGRRGFVEAGVVAAPDEDSAWQRFLDANPHLAPTGLP